MNPMMFEAHIQLIAQEEHEGWRLIVYLIIFVVLPILSSLGAKLREKFKKGDDEPVTDGDRTEGKRPPPLPPRRIREAAGVRPVATAKPPDARGQPPRARPAVLPAPKAMKPAMSEAVLHRESRRADQERRPVDSREAMRQVVAYIDPRQSERIRSAQQARESTRVRRTSTASARAKRTADKPVSAEIVDASRADRSIQSWLRTPRDVRDAVILSEILQPPLALRDSFPRVP